MAAAASSSVVEEAKKLGLVPIVSRANRTGYEGVQQQADGKYQAKFRDVKRKKPRGAGRYDSARDAALARAYAMHMQEQLQEEQMLPSPAKRKKRCDATATPSMSVQMATPMTAAAAVCAFVSHTADRKRHASGRGRTHSN